MADPRLTQATFEVRHGDSPGGYWATISRGGAQVATVYAPGLADEIAEMLNSREPHSADCECLLCEQGLS